MSFANVVGAFDAIKLTAGVARPGLLAARHFTPGYDLTGTFVMGANRVAVYAACDHDTGPCYAEFSVGTIVDCAWMKKANLAGSCEVVTIPAVAFAAGMIDVGSNGASANLEGVFSSVSGAERTNWAVSHTGGDNSVLLSVRNLCMSVPARM